MMTPGRVVIFEGWRQVRRLEAEKPPVLAGAPLHLSHIGTVHH